MTYSPFDPYAAAIDAAAGVEPVDTYPDFPLLTSDDQRLNREDR